MLNATVTTRESEEKERAIIAQYQNLAHDVTGKLVPKDSESYNDAFQHASLGVLHAYRTYDESKGTKFITHAWNCAYNAVRKYTRSDTGLMHIPHNSKEKPPAYVELPLDAASNALDELDQINIKIVLGDAISVLTEDEKTVLACTYGEGKKAEEVAEILGIEVARVYKLTQKALKKLKKNFESKNVTIQDFI